MAFNVECLTGGGNAEARSGHACHVCQLF